MKYYVGMKAGDDADEWTIFPSETEPDAAEYDELAGPFDTQEEAETEAGLWYLEGVPGSVYRNTVYLSAL